jgi:hypothetical protein
MIAREFLVLLVILALLIFGPRRGGGRPGPAAIFVGIALLAYLVVAFGFSGAWHAIVGDIPQP